MEHSFDRTEKLIGTAGLKKLGNAHVAVFGLGGVGSFTVEALARVGVGSLTLIDNDIVAPSNINRQLYALNSTIGRSKTELALERVKDINPECKVEIITEFYLPENRDLFFTRDYTYIVDAIDTVTAKIDLVVQAEKRGIPIISAMGAGNKLDPFAFKVADIFDTSVCPLCRVMRRELRARGIKSLKLVYSQEPPVQNRQGAGDKTPPASISFVPSVAGLLLASEVVKDIIT